MIVHNNCPFPIWPGFMGRSHSNPNWNLPFNGGWLQNAGETKSFQVPKDLYASRLWSRTGCTNVNGRLVCETGGCGDKVECEKRGGEPPVSLAEFTLNGSGNQDFYDVSLVDGWNLPITIEALNPYTPSQGNVQYWCKSPSCTANINSRCPGELQKKNSQGKVVSCYSACMKLNTDQFCCRGAFNTPDRCNVNGWPAPYYRIFKDVCPTAYSYAFDDPTSTFFCRNTNYKISFC